MADSSAGKGKLESALDLLDKDISWATSQWEAGSPFKSLLQRNDITFDQLMDTFNPEDDENEWCVEYSNTAESPKLQTLRKRMSFLKASRKEFAEEYDPEVTDVDFIRLMQVPFTDSEYVIQRGYLSMRKR